jgi:hypothetical protein
MTRRYANLVTADSQAVHEKSEPVIYLLAGSAVIQSAPISLAARGVGGRLDSYELPLT